jgi:hypothetical protein
VDYNTTTGGRPGHDETGNRAPRNDAPIWTKSTRKGSLMFNVAVATIILTRDYLLGVMRERAPAQKTAAHPFARIPGRDFGLAWGRTTFWRRPQGSESLRTIRAKAAKRLGEIGAIATGGLECDRRVPVRDDSFSCPS